MTPLRDADRHSLKYKRTWFKASPTRVLSDGGRHVDVAISVRDRLWGLASDYSAARAEKIQPRQLGNHTL
ncbi:hypothetical protein EXIGLDRAFT_730317, partial [Exidia glandulosa HHB12029]